MQHAGVIHAIAFLEPPAVGLVLLREGQRYELTEIRPYVRRDGASTWLLVWKAHCADCDAVFEVATGLTASTSKLNRRCPAHHSPRRAVTAAGAERCRRYWRRRSAGKRHGRPGHLS